MRKLLALALAWPLLTGCAAASTVADEPSGYTPPSSVAPADPLDTDANRTACSAARREVSKRAAVFADLVKGTATAADGEKAAKELQGEMRDISSFAESDIRVQTVALTDAYVGCAWGWLRTTRTR